jgi:hypothetical protein
VVGCFAASAVGWLREDPEVPGHVADLCAYEAARWSVADESDERPAGLLEFAFDRRPALASAVRLLALQHAVHLEPAPAGVYPAGEFLVCVYRRAAETKARFFSLNPVTYALLQRFATSAESVTRSVEHVAAQRSVAVDEAFLDGLCTVLADFLERGIILGSH